MGSRLLTLRITALTLPISSLIGRGVRSPSRFTYTPAMAANTIASARKTRVRKPHKPVQWLQKPKLNIPVILLPAEPSKTPQDGTPHEPHTVGSLRSPRGHSKRTRESAAHAGKF